MGGQGGEYEPRNSRNVTGTSTNQTGDRWSRGAQGGRTPDTAGNAMQGKGAHEVRFDPDPVFEQRVTGGESEFAFDADLPFADEIEEHMRVVGCDGEPIGTVDAIEGERIRLAWSDWGGDGDGTYRFLPLELVAAVEGDMVRLSTSAAQARNRVTTG